MRFRSTRGGNSVSFCEAVAQGLAPDGGLYLPEEFPDLRQIINEWKDLDYPSLCIEFFRYFATDLPSADLENCVNSAYAGFTNDQTAPLIDLGDHWKCLELFHGPTLAFKDFALQLLGNFYEAQIAREEKPLCILGARYVHSCSNTDSFLHFLLGLYRYSIEFERKISSFELFFFKNFFNFFSCTK